MHASVGAYDAGRERYAGVRRIDIRDEVALVVPVKSFAAAKARLAPVLTADQRARLARWSGARVLAAADHAGGRFVVCDDRDVAAWAEAEGATVIWQPGRGLNPAVDGAVAQVAAAGFAHVVIAHADLACPRRLMDIAVPETVILVPDRVLDGTNVMSFPLASPIAAAYGTSSFRQHLHTALEVADRVAVRRDSLLAIDLDRPGDLLHPLVVEVLPTWAQTNLDNRESR